MSEILKTMADTLTELSHVVKTSGDPKKIEASIKSAREQVKKLKQSVPGGEAQIIDQLDSELSTWQSKLDIIFSEPVGRQGMAKHALHWAERLKRS